MQRIFLMSGNFIKVKEGFAPLGLGKNYSLMQIDNNKVLN